MNVTGVAVPLAAANPLDHVLPHSLFFIGPMPFTNHTLMMLIVGVLMLILFPLLARNYPLAPTGIRCFFETGLEFVREAVARPVLHEHTDRLIPFVWTLFFFILFNNLLGMIPLSAAADLVIGRGHLFGTATAGLSVTAGLAVVAFIMTHVCGCLQHYHHYRHQGRSAPAAAVVGFVKYWYGIVPPVPGILGVVLFPLLFVLELITALVRPFALAIRLFANIMAGHTLLAALLLLIPAMHNLLAVGIAAATIAGCVALSFLEVFVAFLHAYIFTFLTCLFIGMAVSPEH